MKFYILILSIFLFSPVQCVCGATLVDSAFTSEEDIENALEAEEITFEEYLEWVHLYQNPIQLNEASMREIQSLPQISEIDASKIILDRRKNGYFMGWHDFISRKIIDENKLEQIKIFITFGIPQSKKSRGELRYVSLVHSVRNFSRLASNFNSFEGSRSRIKIKNLQGRMHVGGTFIKGSILKSTYIPKLNSFQFKNVNRFQIIKGYMGYENNGNRSDTITIKQFYVGHYRIGFFEGNKKVRSFGLFGDERMFKSGNVITSQSVRTMPLVGTALKIGNSKMSYSGFYSSGRYPSVFSVSESDPNSVSRKDPTSHSFEKILKTRTYGGYLDTKIFNKSHIGAFWSDIHANYEVPGYKNMLSYRPFLWGVQADGSLLKAELRVLYSRSNQSLQNVELNRHETSAPVMSHSEKRNFMAFYSNIPMNNKTAISFSYLNRDRGFYNPIGTVFNGTLLKSARLKINHIVSPRIRFEIEFKEEVKNTEKVRNYGYRIKRKISNNKNILFQQSLERKKKNNQNIFTNNHSIRLKTKIRLRYRIFEEFNNFYEIEFINQGNIGDRQTKTGEKFTYKMTYDGLKPFQFLGLIRISDTNITLNDSETVTVYLEVKTLQYKKTDLLFSWTNRYQKRKKTYLINGNEQDFTRGITTNTLKFRIVYKW